jgi:hypothetical protein
VKVRRPARARAARWTVARRGSPAAAAGVAGLVAAAVLSGCSGSGSPFTRSDKSIYIRYLGNPAGVYDAYCFPVSDPPEGHIFEITKVEKVNVIDATYEFLPDGLKVDDPRAVVRYYDCKDFDLHPAPATTTSAVPTTASASTTAPESTVAG